MRTTRRLLELRSSGLVTLLACLSLPVTASVSCSSDDDNADPHPGSADASIDAAVDAEAADASDGGTKDAAVVDAAPLPIRCDAPPCAVALATTLESETLDGAEGYCALLSDGTVACWGANTAGQLGNGETSGIDSAVAVRVPGLSGITSINHTCSVDSDGAVWCWGRGPFVEDAGVGTTVGSPVRINLPAPADAVAVGRDTACALLGDQSLVCWGGNANFILGTTPDGRANHPPKKVELPAGAKSIAVGLAAFVLYQDGTMLSWGANPGVGRATSFQNDAWPSPVALDHVTMIDTIDVEACAVANGVGWCWGKAPKPAAGATADSFQRALPAAVDTPELITRIATSKTRSASESNSEFEERPRWCATSVSGEVYCWGLNDSGQAGDGSKDHALTPVRVAGLPAPAAEVKIMPYSSCAILTNGRVYCWGNNNYGQLGAGLPKGAMPTPTEVKFP